MPLSPEAIQALQHAAVGTIGGAALGGLTAEKGKRARGAVVGGALGGLAAGGGSYVSGLNSRGEINGLQSANTGLKSEIDTAKAQHAGLQQNYDSLQHDYTEVGRENSARAKALRLMANDHDHALYLKDDAIKTLQMKHDDLLHQRDFNATVDRNVRAQRAGSSLEPLPPHSAATPIQGTPSSSKAPLPTFAPMPAPPPGTNVGRLDVPQAIKPERVRTMVPGQVPRTYAEQQAVGSNVRYPKLVQAFEKDAFEPWQAAALGGIANAGLTGGMTALSQNPGERDWGQVGRNAALGGLVGAAGSGAVSHLSQRSGFNAGHMMGNSQGYVRGATDFRSLVESLARGAQP